MAYGNEKSQWAHNKHRQAETKGQIAMRPETCELCGTRPPKRGGTGRPNIVAHHWNGYDKPLDVWYICPSCNLKLSGPKFHNGSVTKEQAREFIQSKIRK